LTSVATTSVLLPVRPLFLVVVDMPA